MSAAPSRTEHTRNPAPSLASGAPGIALVKYHALGNDFLIAMDPHADPHAGPHAGLGAETARRACDRHRGFGADGLIGLDRCGTGEERALSFRLWNSDGSEAEVSGNGLRCVAHAALDAGWISSPGVVEVVTPAGRRRVRVEARGAGLAWAAVDMGVAVVAGDGERCNVGTGSLEVSVGNPHLVVAGPDPAGVDVASLGAALERSVPGGRNVEFVALGPGAGEITMRVWERGVGETKACGSGSCAAAVAFHHWGRVGPSVTVNQPGGAVTVDIADGGAVVLSGPSERVGSCLLGYR